MVQEREREREREQERRREGERERVYQERCFANDRRNKIQNHAMDEMDSKHNRVNEVDPNCNFVTEGAGLKR